LNPWWKEKETTFLKFLPMMSERVAEFDALVMNAATIAWDPDHAGEWAVVIHSFVEMRQMLPGYADNELPGMIHALKTVLNDTTEWTQDSPIEVSKMSQCVKLSEECMILDSNSPDFSRHAVRLRKLLQGLGSNAVKKDLCTKVRNCVGDVLRDEHWHALALSLGTSKGVDLRCCADDLRPYAEKFMSAVYMGEFCSTEEPVALQRFEHIITVMEAAGLNKERATMACQLELFKVSVTHAQFLQLGENFKDISEQKEADGLFGRLHRRCNAADIQIANAKSSSTEVFDDKINAEAMAKARATCQDYSVLATEQRDGKLRDFVNLLVKKASLNPDTFEMALPAGCTTLLELRNAYKATVMLPEHKDLNKIIDKPREATLINFKDKKQSILIIVIICCVEAEKACKGLRDTFGLTSQPAYDNLTPLWKGAEASRFSATVLEKMNKLGGKDYGKADLREDVVRELKALRLKLQCKEDAVLPAVFRAEVMRIVWDA